MNRLFDANGPVISFCERVADLMLLNILFLILCVPIISVGAAISALDYITMKMEIDKEDGHFLKLFLRAFVQNFKMSTVLWLIYCCVFAVLGVDYCVFTLFAGETPFIVWAFIIVVSVITIMNLNCTLALQGRFTNRLKQTVKNSLIICTANFGKCFMSSVIFVAPIYLLLCVHSLFPVVLLLGFSGSAYINCFFWRGLFSKYANKE